MDLTNETFAQYATPEMLADETFKPYAAMKGSELIESHKELSAKSTALTGEKTALEERLGKSIEPLGDQATDEDRAAFNAKVRGMLSDIPGKPGEYKLNLREGITPDDPVLSAVLEGAANAKMSHAQMQAVYDALGASVLQMEKKALETTDASLKKLWGTSFDANQEKNMQTLRAMAQESGLNPDDTLKELGHLRRNEGFMRMLNTISRHYTEAQIKGSGTQDTGEKSAIERFADKLKAKM